MQELHYRYFEPLSEVAPSLAVLEAGLPVKKLLFMTDPSVISGHVGPYWEVLARPVPPFSSCTHLSPPRSCLNAWLCARHEPGCEHVHAIQLHYIAVRPTPDILDDRTNT